MSEAKKTIRILPTPHVTGYWHYEESDYPDEVRIVMSNGEKIVYERKIGQPGPNLIKPSELLKLHTYGYKAKHSKKSR